MPATMPTLGEYLTSWLAEVVRPGLEPATYIYYEAMVRLYISPALGTRRLDRLRASDVQAWLSKLPALCQCCLQGKDAARPQTRRRCCATGSCCRELASARTVQAARNTLRTALGHATARRELPVNAAALATPPPRPRTRTPRPNWTFEDATRFLTSARDDDDPLYAAYVLVTVHGLSRGQVLGLTWPSIDPDRAELDAAWQLQRAGANLIHKKQPGTSNLISLAEASLAALRHRRTQQDTARSRAGDRWPASDLVFTTRRGTAIEPRNFNRSFDTRCARAGVPRIRVRDAISTGAALTTTPDEEGS